MSAKKKEIVNRFSKKCSLCDESMRIVVYENGKYRGGHSFGKIPVHRKKDVRNAIKHGTHKVSIGEQIFDVLNKDPKPYAYREYWECPNCYWRK